MNREQAAKLFCTSECTAVRWLSYSAVRQLPAPATAPRRIRSRIGPDRRRPAGSPAARYPSFPAGAPSSAAPPPAPSARLRLRAPPPLPPPPPSPHRSPPPPRSPPPASSTPLLTPRVPACVPWPSPERPSSRPRSSVSEKQVYLLYGTVSRYGGSTHNGHVCASVPNCPRPRRNVAKMRKLAYPTPYLSLGIVMCDGDVKAKTRK